MTGHLKQFLSPVPADLLPGYVLLKLSIQDLQGFRSAHLLCIPVTSFLRYAKPCAQRPPPGATLHQCRICLAKQLWFARVMIFQQLNSSLEAFLHATQNGGKEL